MNIINSKKNILHCFAKKGQSTGNMDFEVSPTAVTIFLLLAIQTLEDIPNPTNIYLFKVSNRKTRIMIENCLKLTIQTIECRH